MARWAEVRAMQGDTVDLIAHRHYGDTSQVEAIYRTNAGLAALGPILPQGTLVRLPPPERRIKPAITLW